MITRCKDCIHSWHDRNGKLRCEQYGVYNDAPTFAENFCSFGRRTYAEGFDNKSIIEQLEREYLKNRKEVIGV